MTDTDYAAAFAEHPKLLALYDRAKRALQEQQPLIVATEAPFLIDNEGDIASACGMSMELLRPDEVKKHHHVLTDDLRFVAEELLEGQFDPDEIQLLEAFAENVLRALEELCLVSDIAHADALRSLNALN